MAKIAVTLESAKELHAGRKAACSADRLSAALYERLAAETLLAAKGQSAERAATMYFRMAVALEVLAERKGLAGPHPRAAGQDAVASGGY